jgi:probable phosphomutase (TIGR03848 family)
MPSRRPKAPSRCIICFVRHGTTPTTGKVLPGRAKGLHLSEKGLEEAARTAERLSALGSVRALYASPLERARETAGVIGKRLGLPTRIERRLLECDFGDWTGASLAELAKLPEWQTVQRHPSGFRFPNGESFTELAARVAGAIERLVAQHPGQVIVAVSHADPIKIAIADALGQPLDLMQRTVISPCSVSVVAYSSGPPVVLAMNTTSELASLGIAPPAETNKAPRRRSVVPA